MKNKFDNIVVDGPNRVGKNTLIKKLNKELNYNYVIYDRGIISNYIFDNLFKRKNNRWFNKPIKYLIEYIKKQKNILFVIMLYDFNDDIKATKTESKDFIQKENECFAKTIECFHHAKLENVIGVYRKDNKNIIFDILKKIYDL